MKKTAGSGSAKMNSDPQSCMVYKSNNFPFRSCNHMPGRTDPPHSLPGVQADPPAAGLAGRTHQDLHHCHCLTSRYRYSKYVLAELTFRLTASELVRWYLCTFKLQRARAALMGRLRLQFLRRSKFHAV